MFRVTDPAQPRPTHVRYHVLAALCVVTVINYVQRNAVGSLATSIRISLEIDKRALAISGFLVSLVRAVADSVRQARSAVGTTESTDSLHRRLVANDRGPGARCRGVGPGRIADVARGLP